MIHCRNRDRESRGFSMWCAVLQNFCDAMNLFTTSSFRKIFKRVPPHLLCGIFCASIVFSSLAACGNLTGPGIEPPLHTTERTAKVNSIPEPEETVRGKEDPPQVTLQIGGAMHSARLRPT